MAISRRAILDVFPATAVAEHQRLFAALSAAFAVTFRPVMGGRDGADGVIAFAQGSEIRVPDDLGAGRLPVLVAAAGGDVDGVREPVKLHDEPGLDRRLRRIALEDRLAGSLEPVERGTTVLASGRSGPAWTVSQDGPTMHHVNSVLAELEPHDVLWSMLSQRPIAFVALIQFLRSIPGAVAWTPPPLRATFMFDDPNLRWRSYGFIDYRRLLAHADEHGYHAAMATIPLDCGWTHRPTADLFARRPDRLSLLVHGNDHVKQELRLLRDRRSGLAVAAQAVRRIERLQRRSGVRIDRVMTPPHGLCSEATTRALAAVGFAALCAEHPLPWTEHVPSDDLLAAWRPAEFVGGCPVIPRQPLDSIPASIALRAFLDQPLVIYGHHRDLADGYERLEEIAALVNRLGDVRWVSMAEMARANVELRVRGPHAALRPLARGVRVGLPEAVTELTVEEPDDLLADKRLTGWSLPDGTLRAFGESAPVPRVGVSVRLHGADDVSPEQIKAPPWRPWPKLRRVAVEARDRGLAIGAVGILAR